MAVYTGLLAALWLGAATLVDSIGGFDTANGRELGGPDVVLLTLFLLGIFLNGWVANILVKVLPKR